MDGHCSRALPDGREVPIVTGFPATSLIEHSPAMSFEPAVSRQISAGHRGLTDAVSSGAKATASSYLNLRPAESASHRLGTGDLRAEPVIGILADLPHRRHLGRRPDSRSRLRRVLRGRCCGNRLNDVVCPSTRCPLLLRFTFPRSSPSKRCRRAGFDREKWRRRLPMDARPTRRRH